MRDEVYGGQVAVKPLIIETPGIAGELLLLLEE